MSTSYLLSLGSGESHALLTEEGVLLGPIIAGAMNRLGLNGRMSCMSNSIWIKAEARLEVSRVGDKPSH